MAAECTGGTPTPPPGCGASCSYCRCGQGDGCGGNCSNADSTAPANGPQYTVVANGTNFDAADNIYYFRTDENAQITIEWATSNANIDLIEYRMTPSDVNGNNLPDNQGNSGCDHQFAKCNTVSGTTTSMTMRPRTSRYIRARVRRRTCCGTWSPWRERVFRMDGLIGGQVLLDSNASAAVAADNHCYDSTTATYNGADPTITSTGAGYTFSDPTLNNNKRYTTYLPIQHPGNVQVTASGLPAGYVCTCPQGCSYLPAAGIDAANTTNPNGGGQRKDVNFFLRACTNTCTPQCGQVNDCGNTCASTDAGAPGVPTLTSPTPNQSINVGAATTVTLNFTRGTGAEQTYVNIYPTGSSANEINNCPNGTHPGRACVTTAATSYNFTFDPNIAQYTVRLTGINTTCNAGGTWGLASAAVNFTLTRTISGTVALDPNGSATLVGNFCQLLTPGSNTGASNVNASNPNGSVGAVVAANGTYTINTPLSTSGTTVTASQNAGYICTCPTGCTYGGVTLPSTGVNFYLSQTSGPWFRIAGGSGMALQLSGGKGGTAIGSGVPTTCTLPGCNPYFLSRNLAGTVGSSGYLVTGGGGVDVSAAAGSQTNQIDQDLKNVFGQAEITAPKERYEYFYKLYKFIAAPNDDFDGLVGRPNKSNAVKPTHTPRNTGITAYYANGNVTIGTPWAIGAGERVVVFVNGNVTVNARTTVANGGFLGIIATGDITFSTALGEAVATSTATNAEGVFIANGVLRIPSVGAGVGDLKFVGAGTFVGWGGVQLQRNYNNGGAGALLNNTNPVELFIYRPDFVINAPTEMKTPLYEWREVNP